MSDFGKHFSPAQWSSIRWAHGSSACTNHNEQYQKLLTRWCFTPLRLAKAYPTAFPYCWRSCGSIRHIFWSCPILQPFWEAIFALISSITRKPCQRAPEFTLLLIGIDDVPAAYHVVVCNILHVARLTIARCWKLNEVSVIAEIHSTVSMSMKKH